MRRIFSNAANCKTLTEQHAFVSNRACYRFFDVARGLGRDCRLSRVGGDVVVESGVCRPHASLAGLKAHTPCALGGLTPVSSTTCDIATIPVSLPALFMFKDCHRWDFCDTLGG